ncbi:unnamed protein product [Cylindrotheca closterium]|uniref:Uncharacterized protein n=1 Tax=Cylindrotheca closterium TaxID=2856 RepID=A0AAD2JK00_9STRA|nr:unnamed protein product [Cylindrotheca closterium]
MADELKMAELLAAVNHIIASRNQAATDEADEMSAPDKKRRVQEDLAIGEGRARAQDYTRILFYNCIEHADTLEDGYKNGLEKMIESLTVLFEFNGLMAGFLFVGLSMGAKPATAIQAAWYFCVIMGFGASVVATLLIFVSTWYLRGNFDEDPEKMINAIVKKWNYINTLSYILTVGQVTMLTIAVNIMVHDLYTDLGPIDCFESLTDGPKCNPNGSYMRMAIFGNVLSLGFFFLVLHFWLNVVYWKDPTRKIHAQHKALEQ